MNREGQRIGMAAGNGEHVPSTSRYKLQGLVAAPVNTIPSAGIRQNHLAAHQHGNMNTAAWQPAQKYSLLAAQLGMHSAARQPGNEVKQLGSDAKNGSIQPTQMPSLNHPFVRPDNIYAPIFRPGMSLPNEPASQPVRQPEMHQPVRQLEMHQPVRHPEYHQPVRHPEMHQFIRQPEYHQPVRQPEYQQPVRQPKNHQPIKHPQVYHPVGQPEMHEFIRQPEIFKQVWPPRPPYNLTHSGNSSSTSANPGVSLAVPHSALQQHPNSQAASAIQMNSSVDSSTSHGEVPGTNRQPLPYVHSNATTINMSHLDHAKGNQQSEGMKITSLSSDIFHANASVAVSKSSSQVETEADLARKGLRSFLTPEQAALAVLANAREAGAGCSELQQGQSTSVKSVYAGNENMEHAADSHEDNDDDVIFQGVELSSAHRANCAGEDRDSKDFSLAHQLNLQPAMLSGQPGGHGVILQRLINLLKNCSSPYFQAGLPSEANTSSEFSSASSHAAEATQQAAAEPSLITSSTLLQQSVPNVAVDDNTPITGSDDEDCIILDFSDDNDECCDEANVHVKQSTSPQAVNDADGVTGQIKTTDNCHDVHVKRSTSPQAANDADDVTGQKKTADNCRDVQVSHRETEVLSVQSADNLQLKVMETVSLLGQTSSSLAPKAKSLSELSMEGFYRCGGYKGQCSFNTLLPSQLELHLREAHPADGTYPCVHCGSQEMGQGNFLCHLEQHLSFQSLSLYCSVMTCDFSSASPDEVISHMGVYHPSITTVQVCWRCNTKFGSLNEFSNHVKQNLLLVVKCPHCSAKCVDRRAILTHIATSHPDHGRMISIQKVLLCQERKLNCWSSTVIRNSGDMPILERAEPCTKAVKEQGQSITGAKPSIPISTGIDQSGAVITCRGEVSSKSPLYQNIGVISPELEAKMKQKDLHEVTNDSRCEEITVSHNSSNTDDTPVQEREPMSPDDPNDAPSFDHDQNENEDSASWINHTYSQKNDEEDLEVCLDVADTQYVICSFCAFGSKSVEDHLRHILAFHQEHFRGFACQNCDFVSVDPEGKHDHSCRFLRSQSGINDPVCSAELSGSSSSARTRVFDPKKERKVEVPSLSTSQEALSPRKKPKMADFIPMRMTLRNSSSRQKSFTTDVSLRKKLVSHCGKSSPRKPPRTQTNSHVNGKKLPLMRKTCRKKQLTAKNIPFTGRKSVTAAEQFKPSRKTFKCKLCGKVLATRASLRTHLYTRHPDTMSCPLCQEQLSSDLLLFRHFLQKHPDQRSFFQQAKVSNYISVGYWPLSSSVSRRKHEQQRKKDVTDDTLNSFPQEAVSGGRTAGSTLKYSKVAKVAVRKREPECSSNNLSLSPERFCATPTASVEKHAGSVKFKRPMEFCKLCSFRSVSSKNVRQHIYKQHNEMTRCPECGACTTSDRDLYHHLRQEHVQCPDKDSLYRQVCSRNWFTSHCTSGAQATRTRGRFKYAMLYCKLCKHSGRSRARMCHHVYLAHKEVTQCSICGAYPFGDRKLYRHLFDHHFEEKNALYSRHHSANWFTSRASAAGQREPSKSRNEAASLGTTRHANPCSRPSQSQKQTSSQTTFVVVHCKLCSFVSGSHSTMYRHLYLNHVEMQCTACMTQVNTARELQYHLDQKHPERATALYAKSQPVNFMWTETVSRAEAEKISKKSNLKFRSPFVQEEKLTQQDISTEAVSESTRNCDNKWLRCPYCKGKRKTQKTIENEIRYHIHYKPFCCQYCELKAHSAQAVCRHITKNHPGKPVTVNYRRIVQKEERHKALLEKAISQAIVENRESRKVKKRKRKNGTTSRLEKTCREVPSSASWSVAGGDRIEGRNTLKVMLNRLPLPSTSDLPSDTGSVSENSPDHQVCAADSTNSADC